VVTAAPALAKRECMSDIVLDASLGSPKATHLALMGWGISSFST